MESLDPDTRASLGEHVARIKHDLGKYVAFQVRWVAPDADLAARRAALAQDLLATRRGPQGEVDAASLWAEVRRPLVGDEPLPNGARADLRGDPAVVLIDGAMAELQPLLAGLRDGSADEEAVRIGTEAALRVAEACRDLHRRVLGR
jgi:hypothetical protein